MNTVIDKIKGLSPIKRKVLLKKILEQGNDYNLFPLSYTQEGMWFLYKLEPDNPFYNASLHFDFQGTLNVPILKEALGHLVDRHEILRSKIFEIDGTPLQEISKENPIIPAYFDLTGKSDLERKESLEKIETDNIYKSFDFDSEPLVRISIIKKDEQQYTMYCTIHHIIGDGWSIGVFVKDLIAIYERLLEGKNAELPGLQVQYIDYINWQKKRLNEGVYSEQLDYWKAKLGKNPLPANVLYDKIRPATPSYEGITKTIALNPELLQRVKEFTNRHEISLFMFFISVFNVFLYHYTGDTELYIGTPIANRNREELEKIIGLFANTLVIKNDLDETTPFKDFIQQVKKSTLEAYENQDIPFDKIVSAVMEHRDPAFSPLFQIVYTHQNEKLMQSIWDREIEIPDAQMRVNAVDRGLIQYDLILGTIEKDEGLDVAFSYRSDLFNDDRVDTMLKHYLYLLEQVLDGPASSIGSFSLIREPEIAAILQNKTTLADNDSAKQYLTAGRNDGLGSRLYLLNRNKSLVPDNCFADLYIGGISEQPAAGTLTLQPDPFEPGCYMYNTGDTGYRDGNERLHLTSLHSEHILYGGTVLLFSTIERELIESSLVNQCKVVGFPDRKSDTFGITYTLFYTAPCYRDKEELKAALGEPFKAFFDTVILVKIPVFPYDTRGEINTALLLGGTPVSAAELAHLESVVHEEAAVGEKVTLVTVSESSKEYLDSKGMLAKVLKSRDRAGKSGKKATKSSGEPAIARGKAITGFRREDATLDTKLREICTGYPGTGIRYIESQTNEGVFEDTFETYTELVERSESILGGLRAAGIHAGDEVIVLVEDNHDFVGAFWACVIGGIVPVPLHVPNRFDEKSSAGAALCNISALLEHQYILAGDRPADGIGTLADCYGISAPNVLRISELRTCKPDKEWHRSSPDDTALILFTSGSTGVPKGVQLTHENVVARSLASAQNNGFNPDDRSFNWMPLEHVGSLVMFHIRDLVTGNNQLLSPTSFILEKPLRWLEAADHYRATITWAPNFAFDLINESLQSGYLKKTPDLSCLRFILNGGEAIVPKTARKFLKNLLPYELPVSAMHPAYGMSETSSGVTYHNTYSLDNTADSDQFTCVGEPIPGIEIRIVDNEDRTLTGDTPGRLQIKGTTVTSGYYKNPRQNNEVFTADGWFKTGDVGFIRDGALTITGREKDVIIVNGINYYCYEIESVIQEVEGVKRTFTAACGIREADSNTDKLVVFFVPQLSDGQKLESVIDSIKSRVLSRVGLPVDRVVPLNEEEVEKTAIGKIKRALLVEKYLKGRFHDPANGRDKSAASHDALPNWFYRTTWQKRTQVLTKTDANNEKRLIFTGLNSDARSPVATALAGTDTIVVSKGNSFTEGSGGMVQINPATAGDYVKLVEYLAQRGSIPGHIIHLWGSELGNTEHAFEDFQYHSLYSLLFLLQALNQHEGNNGPHRLTVVTRNCFPVREHDPLNTAAATLPGFLQTVAKEHPGIEVVHIDTDDTDNLPELIVNELAAVTPESQVAFRGGERYLPLLQNVDFGALPETTLPIETGGLYLVTGGLGGIGREVAAFLLDKMDAKVALVGTSELPDKKDWLFYRKKDNQLARRIENYASLEALKDENGGTGDFAYYCADVGDYDDLEDIVAECEEDFDAPLKGIFHLASAGGQSYIEKHVTEYESYLLANEGIDSFEDMFRAKVDGTVNCYRILKEKDNPLFVTFSSLTGTFGSYAYGPYAAANSFISLFSRAVEKELPRTYCYIWSMWQNVGLSEGDLQTVQAASREAGYEMIRKEQGMDSLLLGLAYGLNESIVGIDGGNSHIRERTDRATPYQQHVKLYYTAKDGDAAPETVKNSVTGRYRGELDVDYHFLPSIPLTTKGGVDYQALVEDLPVDNDDERLPEEASDVERKIIVIWEELLNKRDIGLNDKFFEIGGNSLKIVQLLSKIKEVFDCKVEVADLFKYNTVKSLARFITKIEEQNAGDNEADTQGYHF